jgi:hypothetical protein
MSPRAKDCPILKRRTITTLLASLAAVALLGLAAGPAMAQTDDPTDAQYSPPSEIIDSGVAGATDSGGGAVGGATDSGTGTGTGAGSLPFTGLDVALASVVAALLIGTGLLMRRAAREQGAA